MAQNNEFLISALFYKRDEGKEGTVRPLLEWNMGQETEQKLEQM